MTSRQWSILLVLLAANVLLICCVAPSAFLLLTQPDQYSLQAALNNLPRAAFVFHNIKAFAGRSYFT